MAADTTATIKRHIWMEDGYEVVLWESDDGCYTIELDGTDYPLTRRDAEVLLDQLGRLLGRVGVQS